MISHAQAWETIAQTVEPLPPSRVELAKAANLVVAEDIVARDDSPPFAAAGMDGYAVIADDPSAVRTLVGEQEAGLRRDYSISPGFALRIMTGGALPEGADAVLPFEQSVEHEGLLHPQFPIKPGANVRPVGQDIKAGEVAMKKGTPLGPPEIGLLASLNYSEVLVYPRPRVFVFASGNELVRVGAPLRPGQIRDSNTLALSAALRAAGAEPIARPDPVADTQTAIEQAIRTGFISADMVISTGGVSMGRRDLIKEVVSGLGEILVGRVAIKPGKPLTYALITGKPFFGLPGFPVSSLVCFEQFVRPVLRILAGHRLLWRPSMRIKLAQTLKHDPDRTEFQRVCVCCSGEGAVAYSTGGQSSGRLKSLVGANGLAVLSAGKGDYDAGEEVEVIFINLPELRE